jgi:hypothetical protein
MAMGRKALGCRSIGKRVIVTASGKEDERGQREA